MKGLKKVALVSAIAAISAGAQAELKALDDTLMGEMTGQAGLTIDVETKWTLGEFMYKDGGSLVIQNMALGGNVNETPAADNIQDNYLDNIRLTIDIAGSGALNNAALGTIGGVDNRLAWGFSDLRSMALLMKEMGNANGDVFAVSSAGGGTDNSRQSLAGVALAVDATKTYGDGDLVIHSSFTDAWQKGGGFAAYAQGAGTYGGARFSDLDFAETQEIVSRAVDFSFGFEVLGLASSGYQAGTAITNGVTSTRGFASETFGSSYNSSGVDATTNTTTLISNLSINGYFGPSDMIIENKGNGFGANTGTYAYGDANSKIITQRYINITDLDVYIDIAGVKIDNMKINNSRGDLSGLDGTSSFGFAHAKRDISAVKDNVLDLGRAYVGGFLPGVAAMPAGALETAARAAYYTDGIKLANRFKGDIEIGALSFGNDGRSIGQLYFTDYEVNSNLTISAH